MVVTSAYWMAMTKINLNKKFKNKDVKVTKSGITITSFKFSIFRMAKQRIKSLDSRTRKHKFSRWN